MTVTLTRTSMYDTKKFATRQTLVRNVMDFLEYDIGWDEAQYICDVASKDDLLQLIIAHQTDDNETKKSIIEKYN